jgi:hypothetical protein
MPPVQTGKIQYDRGDEDNRHRLIEELVDKAAEQHAYRQNEVKGPDEGCLVVTIAPGDELGELDVLTQFEGEYFEDDQGQYDRCQRGQNRVLLRNMDDLRQILEDLGGTGEFTADYIARPCKHARVPVAVEMADKVLTRKTDVETAIGEQWAADERYTNQTTVTTDHSHQVQQRNEISVERQAGDNR